MSLTALDGLLVTRRFVASAGPAGLAMIQAVPELADGAPLVVEGERGPSVLVPADPVLTQRVFGALVEIADAAVNGRDTVPDGATLARDPLVVELAARVAVAARAGGGRDAAVLLHVVRVAGGSLAAPQPPLTDALMALAAQEPQRRGTTLERIAAGMQARVSAGVAAAALDGAPVGAFATAVAGSRLALLLPAGPLDLAGQAGWIAPAVRNPLPQAVAAAIPVVVRAALAEIAARRQRGALTPDDHAFLVRFCGPERLAGGTQAAAEAVAADASAVAFLLAGLGRWVTREGLAAAPPEAQALLSPGSGLAAAASWGELLADLARWEVVAAFASALEEVSTERPDGALLAGVSCPAAVVAVGLGRLRAAGPEAEERVSAAWARCAEGLGALVSEDTGPVGYLVFADVETALRAVVRLPGRFAETRMRPPVSMGYGELSGRSDGRRATLWGSAVDAALRWLALAPLESARGLRRLGVVGGALCGDGIGVSESAREQLAASEGLRSLCEPGETRAGTEIGLAVALDEVVVLLAGLGSVSGGWELLRLSEADWAGLPVGGKPKRRTKKEAGASGEGPSAPEVPPARAPVAAAPPAPAPPPPGSPSPGSPPPGSPSPGSPPGPPPVRSTVRTVSPAAAPIVMPPIAVAAAPSAPSGDPFAPEESRAGPYPTAAPLDPDSRARVAAALGDAPPPAPSGRAAPAADPFGSPDDPFAGFAPPAATAESDPFGAPTRPLPVPAPPAAEAAPTGAAYLDDDLLGDVYGAGPSVVPTPPAPEPEPWSASPAAAADDPFASAAGSAPGPAASKGGGDPFAFADDPFASEAPPAAAPAPAASAAPTAAADAAGFQFPEPDGGDWLERLDPDEPTDDGGAEADDTDEDARTEASAIAAPQVVATPPMLIEDPGEPAAPPAEPARAASPARPKRAGAGAGLKAAHLAPLFQGYVVYTAGTSVVFGQVYGTRVVDRHEYAADLPIDRQYLAFLRDKIDEGFVPRTDRIGDLPAGTRPTPLDLERLGAALGDL